MWWSNKNMTRMRWNSICRWIVQMKLFSFLLRENASNGIVIIICEIHAISSHFLFFLSSNRARDPQSWQSTRTLSRTFFISNCHRWMVAALCLIIYIFPPSYDNLYEQNGTLNMHKICHSRSNQNRKLWSKSTIVYCRTERKLYYAAVFPLPVLFCRTSITYGTA